MTTLKSFYKLFWVIEVTVLSVLRLTMSVVANGWSPALVAGHARRWAAALVHGLDIRIETSGPIPDHGALVVSNHRSYLDIVVVFPEGTTTAGPGLLPFKNGIFHLACKKDIPVVPVAVSYENPKAAWIGDDFFLPHFLEIFKTSPLKARLSFGPEIREENGDILKATAHSSIQHQLHAMQSAPSSIQLPAMKNLRPCGP